jgi:hypothetical protein
MERFIFVAAVTFAAISALVVMAGNSIHIGIDGSDLTEDEIVAVAPGRMEAASFTGDDLVIEDAAARILITPEDRADFVVQIDNPGRAPMPSVASEGDQVRIDGHLRGRVGSCREGGGVNLEGYGDLTLADLPQITIRAPRSLNVRVERGSSTEIGPSQALSLEMLGCGHAMVGDVSEALAVEINGSGDVGRRRSRIDAGPARIRQLQRRRDRRQSDAEVQWLRQHCPRVGARKPGG